MRVDRERHAQRAREGLEHRLALMVRVVALEVVDVHRDAGVVREALEKLVGVRRIERADAGGELGLACAVEVDAHADLRLLGVALVFGDAHYRLAFGASIINTFSTGVRSVSRRQFASSGFRPSTFFTSTPRSFMPAK